MASSETKGLMGQAFHEKAEEKKLLLTYSPTYTRIHMFQVFFFDFFTLVDGNDLLFRNVNPTTNLQMEKSQKIKGKNLK
jgi:hypothetical protein